MSSMDNVKKRIIISMCSLVLLILTLVGITYAYFASRIQGNNNDKSVNISAGNLALEYSDGNGEIVLNKIKPGTTLKSKTFSVENTGTQDLNSYEVYLENVVNELMLYKDLTYELVCESSLKIECNGSNGVFPRNDKVIVRNSIKKNEIQYYTLTIKYNETNKDQSIDMNKEVRALVNIKDDYVDIKKLNIYGNSIQNGSPSPSNPVEIQSLGDKTKNLLQPNLFETTTKNKEVKLINDNGRVSVVGSATISSNIDKVFIVPNPQNLIGKTLVINDTGNENVFVYVDLTSNGETISNWISSKNSKYSNIVPSGTTKIEVGVSFNEGDIDYTFYPQLEVGITSSSYEPYGYRIPIIIDGKNLLNKNTVYNNIGLSKIDGTSYTDNELFSTEYIRINPNENYTINWENEKWYIFYDNNKNYLLSGTNKLINSPNNAYYIRIVGSINELDTLQLEQGLEITRYTPYTESITTNLYLNEPLRSVGKCEKCSDYIDFSNSKLYRNVGYYEFDGSENIIVGNNPINDTNHYYTSLDNIITNSSYHLNTHFETGIEINGANISSYYNMYPSTSFGLNTTDSFKGWLFSEYSKGTSIKVLYQANYEPINIETPEIELLEGVNNITVCSTNNVCASNIVVEFETQIK